MAASSPLNTASSSGFSRVGGKSVGNGVGVKVGVVIGVGVLVGRTRVDVGVIVGVSVGVGVCVGVGVEVGVGVKVGVGVVVGVLVGEGVIEGVRDGVSVGTFTRTGTSLAAACTVLTATDGWKWVTAFHTQEPTRTTRTKTTIAPMPISSGRSQSCRKGSPQPGQTFRLRLLTVPQCRQRTRRGWR